MSVYQDGYEMYVAKCEQFGVQPVTFRIYVMQLSTKQLFAYNEYARAAEEVFVV